MAGQRDSRAAGLGGGASGPTGKPSPMLSKSKPRLTYANVAATLALVLSMTGGALAANHYLITSSKQISPKVLKKLKGKNGKNGKEGLAGREGAAGKEGPTGKIGPQGPGAGQLDFTLEASTSPSFAKVG